MSKYYLEHHFPEHDQMIPYVDKFWHSERYFNAVQLEDYLEGDSAYWEFKMFLTTKIFVYPISFLTQHNLFLIHFAFNDYKLGINFHLNKFMNPQKPEPNEMQKLNSKILGYEGWKILDVGEKEFMDMYQNDRVKFFKDWLKANRDKQLDEGIIEPKREYV